MTYREAAEALSVSRATIYRLVDSGTLVRVYIDGIPRITAESVASASAAA